MKQELRPYQKDALEQILKHYKKGERKVLLHLDTGAGKTTIFAEVLKRALDKGSSAIMVVRGRKLVGQASQRLTRESIRHGVLMAGHHADFPNEPIQICSIDTVRSRGLLPKADIIVYDEAHMATSQSYHDFVKNYPSAYHLPVTATPYLDKSLRHIANVVVRPIGMKQLIEQGYLVKARYFAPTDVDLSGCRTQQTKDGIDYVIKDIEGVVNTGAIIGNLADNFIKFSQDRSALIFAVSIRHSHAIVEEFKSKGIKIAHMDNKTKEKDRERIIADLESGKIKAISNVGILGTGVDIPSLGVIVFARPTKSLNLYLQIAGRGTRPFEGKNDFIIIDCVGNIKEHGFITDEHHVDLDGKKKKKTEIKTKTCPSCFAIFLSAETVCPECLFMLPTRRGGGEREATSGDGVIAEIHEETRTDKISRASREVEALIERQRKPKKGGGLIKPGWVFFRLKAKFGDDVARTVYKKIKSRLITEIVINKDEDDDTLI